MTESEKQILRNQVVILTIAANLNSVLMTPVIGQTNNEATQRVLDETIELLKKEKLDNSET